MKRLIVRAPTLDDQDEWLARMRASRSFHSPWISMPVTPAAYRTYVERSQEPGRAFYLAVRIEDGAIVGYLNIGEIIRGKLNSAFVGYGGVKGFEGQGYMTEAMHLVLREAFTTLKLHRLEANIQPGNLPSIALAKRCGFVYEGFSEKYLKVGGRWCDHERWAIRKELWQAARRA